ncbi:hypothetical protein WMO44_00500 [Faecalibacterium sp. CLA-AA-H175]|uniref:Uncharacterized protein n=1 Tax=Faecalibacterium tardum TaxID=3133156 RepID=A0ABV1AUQ3_9FIRM
MLYKTRNFLSHSAVEKFRVLRSFAISPVNRETPFPQEAFPSPEEVKALAPGRSSKVDFRSAAPPPRGCPLPLYPSCEKGVLKSPQVFQNSKTQNIFSAEYAQSEREAHSESSYIKRLLHSALCSSLKYFTFTTDQMLNCTAQKAA